MKTPFLFVLLVLLIVMGCATRKTGPTMQGLQLLEGDWQLVSTTDDDSALNGTIIAIDAGTADGMITVLKKNTYCVRPTDVMWKDIVTTAVGNQFNASNLVNSCVSGLVYKPASLVLVNNEIRLTGVAASGNTLLQTWRRIPK